MAPRLGVGRDRKGTAVRTVIRAPRVCSIATPLLVVTTSPDESAVAAQLFGLVPRTSIVSVFGLQKSSESMIDLRDADEGVGQREPVALLSLDRVPGERTRTDEIAALIGDTIVRTGAATVAIGFGLRGGDHLEASDAALLARRRARGRIAWLVDRDGDAETDAGRIARRRMQLFVRGVRLEPVAVAEAPMGSNARYWQIRAPHTY
jgi:hypothetical protein